MLEDYPYAEEHLLVSIQFMHRRQSSVGFHDVGAGVGCMTSDALTQTSLHQAVWKR